MVHHLMDQSLQPTLSGKAGVDFNGSIIPAQAVCLMPTKLSLYDRWKFWPAHSRRR
jgi:hypothetical protein